MEFWFILRCWSRFWLEDNVNKIEHLIFLTSSADSLQRKEKIKFRTCLSWVVVVSSLHRKFSPIGTLENYQAMLWWMFQTGEFLRGKGNTHLKWNIEVAHVEEKIFEWGTIFCEIASAKDFSYSFLHGWMCLSQYFKGDHMYQSGT